MNKNASLRKLSLNRETLIPLQASDLDDVNGGTGAFCQSAVRISKAWCSQIAVSAIEVATRAFGCNGNNK